MKKNIIQEHPTTHVLIDDNASYLRSLSTILPTQNRIYKYFTNPNLALQWILKRCETNITNKFLRSGLEEEANCMALSVNLNNLHQKILDDERFSSISSLIIDYDMPGLNGIELCRSINNPHIQKILLTGFLDEKEARHALNKGWIDMFLPKGEESPQKIAELLADADNNFFSSNNVVINAVLAENNSDEFLSSHKFREIFDTAYRQCNAIEFYLVNPGGDYLLLDEHGKTFGLSVQNEIRRNENICLATEWAAPSEICEKLKSHQYIFCHLGNLDQLAPNQWEKHILPCNIASSASDLMGVFGTQVFDGLSPSVRAFGPVHKQSMQNAVEALDS